MNAKLAIHQKQYYARVKARNLFLVRNRIYTRDGNQATLGGGRTDETVESRIGRRREREERHVLSPRGSGVYDASQVRPTAGSGIRQQ